MAPQIDTFVLFVLIFVLNFFSKSLTFKARNREISISLDLHLVISISN